jgi:Fic family protein
MLPDIEKEREISRLIKENILRDFQIGERKGLYSLTQKMMAYNSNRIEGSTLTSEQTATLFDTGTITANGVEVYRAKDIEEMQGHFKMFNQMLKYIDEPLSENLIKSYHYQLKSGVFEDYANGYPVGEYKNRANTVSDIQTSLPENVAERMKELIDEYNASSHTLYDMAKFHAEYENIHPFQDGNGRTGRMIMVKQCFDSGHIPVIIRDDDKQEYIGALHKAQKEHDYSWLVEVFDKSRMMYYEQAKGFLHTYERPEHGENPYISEEDRRNK